MRIIVTIIISLCFLVTKAARADVIPRPVVNVIISGSDAGHLNDVLSEVSALSRKVAVRNVVIVIPDVENASALLTSGLKDGTNGKEPVRSPIVQKIAQFGLENSEVKVDAVLLDRLKVSYSPTWLVRDKGADHIYEGYPTIARYFTRDGSFNGGGQ